MRLVILQEKGSSEKVAFIMVTVGEKEYLEKSNFKMWKNTYLKKDSKFEGKAMFYTLYGAYINGWTWEKGKVVYDLKVDHNEADLKVDLRYCGHTTTTTFYEQCTDNYTYGEVGDTEIYTYQDTDCTYWSETTTTYTECPPEPNDPYASSGGVSSFGDNLYDNIYASDIMKKNPIFKCLHAKFIAGNYSTFNATVGAFKDLTDYHVTFRSCEEDNTAGCQTRTSNWEGNNLYIYLDPNEGALKMAETIIHEGIHAALKLHLKGQNIGLTNLVIYLQYLKDYNGYTNMADHIFIADVYIKPVASVLWKLDGGKHPKEKYLGLVYEGLKKWVDHGNLDRLSDIYEPYLQYNDLVKNSDVCK